MGVEGIKRLRPLQISEPYLAQLNLRAATQEEPSTPPEGLLLGPPLWSLINKIALL